MMARKALLIATSQFRTGIRELYSPPGSLRLLSATLKLPHVGFDIAEPLINPGHEHMQVAIEDFITDSSRSDDLLLYLTGHGVVEDGEYYYLLSSTDPYHIRATAISEHFLNTVIKGRCRANSRTIIVDTCHAGKLGGMGPETGEPISLQGLAGAGISLIYASRGNERTYEKPDPLDRRNPGPSTMYYSVFTSALCLSLQLCKKPYGHRLKPGGVADYSQQVIRSYREYFHDEFVPDPVVEHIDPRGGGADLGFPERMMPADGIPSELETYFDRMRLVDSGWDARAVEVYDVNLIAESSHVPMEDAGYQYDPGKKKEDVPLPARNDNLVTDLTATRPDLPRRMLHDASREQHKGTLMLGAGKTPPGRDGWIEMFRSDFIANLMTVETDEIQARERLDAAISAQVVQEKGPWLRFRLD